MSEQNKIQVLEKVGYVGGCQSSPAGYASYLSNSWRTPTASDIARHAMQALEQARQKDIEAHELNIPRMAVNKAFHERVAALMTEIGMPTSWSERDTKSRARYPKQIRHDAGYLADLRREVRTSDGFEQATQSYERLKKAYEEYVAKAEREAETERTKAQREQEAEEAKRREDMELASILIRYKLDVMSTWSDVAEALRNKDKYLNLAIAGLNVRGDWSEGPDEVEAAVGSFTIENERDKDIINDLLGCLRNFADGRVFRDTTWSYDALFAIVENQQLVADAQLANSKARAY